MWGIELYEGVVVDEIGGEAVGVLAWGMGGLYGWLA